MLVVVNARGGYSNLKKDQIFQTEYFIVDLSSKRWRQRPEELREEELGPGTGDPG